MTAALLSTIMILATLAAGVYAIAVIDRVCSAAIGTATLGPAAAGGNGVAAITVNAISPNVFLAPIHQAAAWWLAPLHTTEAPDATAWRLAPVLYLTLAAMGLALVPWSETFVPVDLATGIVLWGALEPLATVLIFLHGWSANAHFALLGSYRYVAIGLSYILVSMFVLIGVALPAESLQISAVVASQQELWNVLRQPLGLPLFLIVGLGISFWGPLDFADSSDLAGGTSAESSGRSLLVWQFARMAMLVSFSGIAAAAFLGGPMGPLLPGPVWLILKMLFILVLLMALGRLLPRLSPERFMTLAWVVLLPLAFIDLVWAGLEALS
ncbi:MAG: complex I subunit 1 family protein [Wenzhouxiangellaceae bacterium]|nr:complex I subunit 1 family protein [Wenzhouxiangellaceae bacterium]